MSITHFQSTCQALIQLTVEALATAPHFTQAQKKIRTEAVVNLIMAFLPTEAIQVMLASQATGHHFSLMDTFQQIHNRALADGISVKMRTISTMETRMTLALSKELRIVRKDMIAAAQAERMVARTAPAEQPVEQPTEPPAPVVTPEPPAPVQKPDAAAPLAAQTADDATFAARFLCGLTALVSG